MKTLCLISVVSLAFVASPGSAEEKSVGDRIREYLASINGEAGRVTLINSNSTAKAFPKSTFAAVLFPQFPVGRQPPELLKPANVLVVPAEGKPTPITTIDELKKFFTANAAAIEDSKAVVHAWLRLAQEIEQDGFYKFKEPGAVSETPANDGGKTARSSVQVDPEGGNKGGISVVIRFSKAGKILAIEHQSDLSPGPRPRCQATKLLDPDPIVRQMAEDSIRVMGRACKFYLDEQRAKASPELQKAIDRIWQRIIDEKR